MRSQTQPSCCLSVEEAVERLGLSRSFLYLAIDPAKAAAKGIPHLASLEVGKRRLIRGTTLDARVAALEGSRRTGEAS